MMLTGEYQSFDLEISMVFICKTKDKKNPSSFLQWVTALLFNLLLFRLSIYLHNTKHTDEIQNIQSIIQLFVNIHLASLRKD